MTYDESKRQINLTTHGIDLALCSCVFDAPMVTKEDDRYNYYEQRLVSLCWFNNRVAVMIWTDRDPVPHVISCRYGDKMKQQATSKPFFDQSTIDAALSAAQDLPVDDPLNPVTSAKDWTDAVVSSSLQDFTQKMTAKRVRGSQKKPLKIPTTIRFDADLLEALKASGKGWQTLVNDAMRDWMKNHNIAH